MDENGKTINQKFLIYLKDNYLLKPFNRELQYCYIKCRT